MGPGSEHGTGRETQRRQREGRMNEKKNSKKRWQRRKSPWVRGIWKRKEGGVEQEAEGGGR